MHDFFFFLYFEHCIHTFSNMYGLRDLFKMLICSDGVHSFLELLFLHSSGGSEAPQFFYFLFFIYNLHGGEQMILCA